MNSFLKSVPFELELADSTSLVCDALTLDGTRNQLGHSTSTTAANPRISLLKELINDPLLKFHFLSTRLRPPSVSRGRIQTLVTN